MAITYVNKSAFASGTGALTVGAVTGVVADDLILLFVESANENIATPTGFTQVTNSPVSTGTAASAGGVRLGVFYRFASGADTTTSVADTGNHTCAIKLAYRGVDRTAPFDATPTTAIKTPASTSSSFPGITTATANACIVHASALDLDSASTATTGTPTNANLTGLVERHDQTVTAGAGGGLVIIEGFKATAGATGNTTATVTSTIQVYLTMALREAPPDQALTPGRYDNAQTFYTHTATAGPVTLTAALYTNDQTFYGPTITATGGAQDLLPDLYTNAQTFYGPTVLRGTITLAPARHDNAQTFYAPTVLRGAVFLQPSVYTNANTFYPAAASQGAFVLAPDRYDNAQTFYAPTVVQISPQALQPALFENAQTFYPARVGVTLTFPNWATPGWVDPGWVDWPYFNTNQFFGAAVTRSVTLTASRLDNISNFFPLLALLEGYPNPADVSDGVVYGPNGVYTGTKRGGGQVWLRRR